MSIGCHGTVAGISDDIGKTTPQGTLISDDEVALALAGKLAADHRTMDANVRFEVYMGVAYLKGTVRSKDQHATVLDLTGKVPHVVRIEDQLTVAG